MSYNTQNIRERQNVLSGLPLLLEAVEPPPPVVLAVVVLGEAALCGRHPTTPASDVTADLLRRSGDRWHDEATDGDASLLQNAAIRRGKELVPVQLPGSIGVDG